MKYGNALTPKEMQQDLRTIVPPLALLHDLQQQVGLCFEPKYQTMFQFEVDTLFKSSEPFSVLESEGNDNTYWLVPTVKELISPFVEDEMRKVAYVIARSSLPLHYTLTVNRDIQAKRVLDNNVHAVLPNLAQRQAEDMNKPPTTPRLLPKMHRRRNRQKRLCKLIEQSFGDSSQETISAILQLAECHRKVNQLDKALRCCLYIGDLLEKKFKEGKFLQYGFSLHIHF